MSNYIIFDYSEANTIDFNQVQETSYKTLRVSNDSTKSVIEYIGDMPSSIQSLTSKEGPYTREQMLDIMTGSIWILEY